MRKAFLAILAVLLVLGSFSLGRAASGDLWSLSLSGSDVLRVNSSGVLVPGTTATYGLGTTSLKFTNVYTSGQYMQRTAITAASGTAAVTDSYIGVNRAGVVTVNLPAAATAGSGAVLVIHDESGAANTNNITIDGNSSETIDGSTTNTISTAYGTQRLICDGSNWFTW